MFFPSGRVYRKMVPFRPANPVKADRARLRKHRRNLNGLGSFAAQRLVARDRFKSVNSGTRQWIQRLRGQLKAACHQGRCPYCEDNTVHQVDHHRPISLDPRGTFLWGNFVYACGICNGKKLHKWHVFDPATSTNQKALDPLTATLADLSLPPVFIDPRREDPADFLKIDLTGTFTLIPRYPAGSQEAIRAIFTRDQLALDEGELPAHRKRAYSYFIERLDRYTQAKAAGVATEIARCRGLVMEQDHLGVWREMQRQHGSVPALTTLFGLAPEALTW